MDLGDFFVQFMDLSEDEMKKNMDGILQEKHFLLKIKVEKIKTANDFVSLVTDIFNSEILFLYSSFLSTMT